MERDQYFMEHTEKLVADVLKYVFVSNNNNNDHTEYKKQIEMEETMEFIFIENDENEEQCSSEDLDESIDVNFENQQRIYNTDECKVNETIKFGPEPPIDENCNDIAMDDIETLISEGLERIRSEYPMYINLSNTSNCNNWRYDCQQNLPMHCMSSNYENTDASFNDNWYNNPITSNGEHIPNVYQEEIDRAIYGNNQYWENDLCRNNSNHSCQNDNENSTNTSSVEITEVSTTVGIDKNDMPSHSKSESTPLIAKDALKTQTNNDLKNQELLKSENNESDENKSSTSIEANEYSIYNGIQSVLETTNRNTTETTTMTSTSDAFGGVLHQQTSSSSTTTTKFVSNNLANAALTTTTAALYAQSLLAQQYLNAILKESQQYTVNGLTTANTSSLNVGIYERLLYAQLLQQQIYQHQQQQQAAIAAVLQQQKLVMQGTFNNNIANAVSAAAVAANPSVANFISNAAVGLIGDDINNASSCSINNCEHQASVSLNISMKALREDSNIDENVENVNSSYSVATTNSANECTEYLKE